MVLAPVSVAPGLYKIFDEILVNAADNKARDPKMDALRVDIDAVRPLLSLLFALLDDQLCCITCASRETHQPAMQQHCSSNPEKPVPWQFGTCRNLWFCMICR